MNIIIVGYGKMGKLLSSLLEQQGHTILQIFKKENIKQLSLYLTKADALIDFSSPSALPDISTYIKGSGAALVSGTTGYSKEQLKILKELSDYAPVLYSTNFSLGIAILKNILKQISPVLTSNDFQVEIIETHHNQKLDAPSGTAKTLLSIIDDSKEHNIVYGRIGTSSPRKKREIGVHSLRGGTIAGEHTVAFLGQEEKIEISHSALSRKIFALGAISAADKIHNLEPGMYYFDEIMI